MSDPQDDLKRWFHEKTAPHGIKARLAEATGYTSTQISRMRNLETDDPKKRQEIPLDMIEKAAKFFKELPPGFEGMTQWLDGSAVKPKTTTIVGRAGAATDGRVIFAEGQGGFGVVEIPEGATEKSVAIEIEGYSQGFIADGCLIFYTEVHAAPTDDMLGQIVVIGTPEGYVLLKRLLRGSRPGLFDLESINGPTLRDQKVSWAAHVDSLVPPWRAARLRVEAGEIGL